jgi:hypothetical protein
MEDNAEKRTKGFIHHWDRNMCEDCVFMKRIGLGSISQKTPTCTKIEPHFTVMLEDVCDEFEAE